MMCGVYCVPAQVDGILRRIELGRCSFLRSFIGVLCAVGVLPGKRIAIQLEWKCIPGV